MAKVYGDKDWRSVAVITLLQRYQRLPHESVRAYANCLKANWRQAGWNLPNHEEVLYDIAWACLRNTLKNMVRPMTSACGRFDTFGGSLRQGRSLGSYTCRKQQTTTAATTAVATTAIKAAYGLVLQRRQTRPPAIHL
jgi:hypothetical protein